LHAYTGDAHQLVEEHGPTEDTARLAAIAEVDEELQQQQAEYEQWRAMFEQGYV
jgi:hypothetical protein